VLRAVATWGVIAAVACIGVAAAVDALRAEERSKHQPVQARRLEAPKAPDVQAQLKEARVRGTIVYADAGCHPRALRLPDLEPTAVPEAAAGLVRSAGTDEPTCEISEPSKAAQPPIFIERGRVLQLVPCGKETLCRRVLLTESDLERGAPYPLSPGAKARFVAHHIAWLGEGRLAVAISGDWNPHFVSVYERGRFLYRTHDSSAGALDVSPRGNYLAQGENLIWLGRRRAAAVTLPGGLPEAQDLAWSPDERWLALATRASIWLISLEEPDRPLIRLPLEARDVAWRA
jgi:hypothetical protein